MIRKTFICSCGWQGATPKSKRVRTGATSSSLVDFCPICDQKIDNWDYEIDKFTPTAEYKRKSDPDEMLDSYQVARFLNIPADAVEKIIRNYKLPCQMVKATNSYFVRTLIKKSDLDLLIARKATNQIVNDPDLRKKKNVWFSVTKHFTLGIYKKPFKSEEILVWIKRTKVRRRKDAGHFYTYNLYSSMLKRSYLYEGRFALAGLIFQGDPDRSDPAPGIRYYIIDNLTEIRGFTSTWEAETGFIDAVKFLETLKYCQNWQEYDRIQELIRQMNDNYIAVEKSISDLIRRAGLKQSEEK